MSEDGAKIYRASAQDFKKIPGFPVGYWVSNKIRKIFENPLFYEYTISDGQNVTGDNARFVRYFWEVSSESIGINRKWLFYAKGGGYRKWYGNILNVVDWSIDARNFYHHDNICRIIPEYLWYEKGITWSLIATTAPSFRLLPEDATFDKGGSSVFIKDLTYFNYYLGLLNCYVFLEVSKILNSTLNYQVKDIRTFPIIYKNTEYVSQLVEKNISTSKTDWDSFEISWDFTQHPFLTHKGATVEESYANWQHFTESQFTQLKANEEELNRIFIEIYGLQDELNPEVKDEDVTIRKADLQRDVKSFISYAVGCMFGRYSIDKPGLILANAGETAADYQAKVPESRFAIDDDNIIPVLDDDYFHDDIVARFREFLKTVYGKETLEENMSFIAHALSPSSKAAPDRVLRDYFLKDFYADHLKIYQKRPIYWMFTSGKQQGFNALIYLHRYNKDTLGKIWGDYLRELEAKLDAEISLLENADKKNTARLAKLKKQRLELKEYDAELDITASKKIELDLDDGVAVNYAKFGKLVKPLK